MFTQVQEQGLQNDIKENIDRISNWATKASLWWLQIILFIHFGNKTVGILLELLFHVSQTHTRINL